MKEFYRRLALSEAVGAALCHTQALLLEEGAPRWKWAGVALRGDPSTKVLVSTTGAIPYTI